MSLNKTSNLILTLGHSLNVKYELDKIFMDPDGDLLSYSVILYDFLNNSIIKLSNKEFFWLKFDSSEYLLYG
jgi:hypothetical protein